jgi:hypothetical protein
VAPENRPPRRGGNLARDAAKNRWQPSLMGWADSSATGGVAKPPRWRGKRMTEPLPSRSPWKLHGGALERGMNNAVKAGRWLPGTSSKAAILANRPGRISRQISAAACRPRFTRKSRLVFSASVAQIGGLAGVKMHLDTVVFHAWLFAFAIFRRPSK